MPQLHGRSVGYGYRGPPEEGAFDLAESPLQSSIGPWCADSHFIEVRLLLIVISNALDHNWEVFHH